MNEKKTDKISILPKTLEFSSYSESQLKKLRKESPEAYDAVVKMMVITLSKVLDLPHAVTADRGYKDLVTTQPYVEYAKQAITTFSKDMAGGDINRRKAALEDLLVDLIPAKELFKIKLITKDEGGFRMQIQDDDTELTGQLQAVVSHDRYEERNKIPRIFAVFNKAMLLSIFSAFSNTDFDEFINMVRLGKIPKQFISEDEMIRVKEYNEYMKQSDRENTAPPKPPARYRFTQIYSDGNLKKAFDQIKKEYPDLSLEYFDMVSLSSSNTKNDVPENGGRHWNATMG